MTLPDAVEQHYSGRGLAERIFSALAAEGHDTASLTPEILAPYDEFHVGGIAATRRFSGRLSLDPSRRLLDVGCGAGGPARTVVRFCALTCEERAGDVTLEGKEGRTEGRQRDGRVKEASKRRSRPAKRSHMPVAPR